MWKTLNDLMGEKSAVTAEISEIQGSSSETLTNAKDIADHLKITASSLNPEDYLRREPLAFEFTEIDPSTVLIAKAAF